MKSSDFPPKMAVFIATARQPDDGAWRQMARTLPKFDIRFWLFLLPGV